MNRIMSTTINGSPWARTVLVASLLVIGLAACDRPKSAASGPAATESTASGAAATPPAEGMEGMEGMDDMPSLEEDQPDTEEPPPEPDPGTTKRKRFSPFDPAKQRRP
jgi:hypothetical protein